MTAFMQQTGIRLITYARFAVLCSLYWPWAAIIKDLFTACSLLVVARYRSIYYWMRMHFLIEDIWEALCDV